MRKLIPILLLSVSTLLAYEWTSSVVVPSAARGNHPVYLWLPPSCEAGVRGIILTSFVSSEALFCQDSLIRSVAQDEQLAIMQIYPSKIGKLAAPDTSIVLAALDSFAENSGFSEIRYAPWFTFGHSVGCHFATNLAWWHPERVAGIIDYKGMILIKPDWCKGDIKHIPILGICGQYEEFDSPKEFHFGTENHVKMISDTIIHFRKQSLDYQMGGMMIVGEGHFAWSKNAAPFIAKFIRKVAQKRIPYNTYAKNGILTLNKINTNTGWIGDMSLIDSLPSVKIDSASTTTNYNKFWFIDKEFAEDWLIYQKQGTKRRQVVCSDYMKPTILPQSEVNYVADGKFFQTTFNIEKTYEVSGWASSLLPTSTFIQSGPASIINGKIVINPCKIVDDNAIRIIIRQDGNDTLKPADRCLKAAVLSVKGDTQIISIPPIIPTLKVGDSLALNCSSSSGLPVSYQIVSGPAEIKGNMIQVKNFVWKKESLKIVVRVAQAGGNGFGTVSPISFTIPITNDLTNVKRPIYSSKKVVTITTASLVLKKQTITKSINRINGQTVNKTYAPGLYLHLKK